MRIEGVLVSVLKEISDGKGDVFDGMKCVEGGFEGFGEVYLWSVLEGLVKGWKGDCRMRLKVVCIVGKIDLVLYDGGEKCCRFGK